jgi:hypothetical protein
MTATVAAATAVYLTHPRGARAKKWFDISEPIGSRRRILDSDGALVPAGGCSQARYVPASELEREVEGLYEGVRVPAALRRRLERVLGVEVAERERHRAEVAGLLSRRLHKLAAEREKLLRADYADAIDVAILKREQARINAEVADAESQLTTDGEKLAQAKQIIDLALDLAEDCAASYRKAKPEVRKMWNRAFFDAIEVRDGAVADFIYEEPFASLLGSHKGSMVVPRGCCSNSLQDLVAQLHGLTDDVGDVCK